MKVILKSLRITDVVGRRSRRIEFSNGINLITSDNNSRGKSVLMKSVYHSLGADCSFDTNIKESNILFEIEFDYGDNAYKVLRYKDSFCTFKNGSLLKYYPDGNRNDLSLFYLDELNMGVFLRARGSQIELSPPAYMFVPYYLDQDRSWKEEQYPFKKASSGQYYPAVTNELYFYSLGLYKKEYGLLKSEIDEISLAIKNLEKERRIIDENYKTVKEANNAPTVCLSQDELDNYQRTTLAAINTLLDEQNAKILELNELDKKRTKCQLRIKNNKYAIDRITEDSSTEISMTATCPNCNTKFDVELRASVINTYNTVLLENENSSLEEEVAQLDAQIKIIKQEIGIIGEKIEIARKKVSDKQTEYEQYFTWVALSKLNKEQLSRITEISSEIDDFKIKKAKKEEIKRQIKKSTEDAKNDFIDFYKKILMQLDIDDFDPNSIKAFYKLSLSGSQYARSTLSLFFAFLYTKNKYNPNDFDWPLVIDSPREGEQDNMNSSKILNFIIQQDTSNHQCILASVNATDYLDKEQLDSINIIKLENEKNRVMIAEEYDEDYLKSQLSFFSRI